MSLVHTQNVHRINSLLFWIILHILSPPVVVVVVVVVVLKDSSENDQSVKQFGSRSGLTFCRA